jgi:hypothetical protein
MGRVTVSDVAAHPGPLDEPTCEWAREAWNAWAAWHGQIRDWHRTLTSTQRAARGRSKAR